MTLHTIFCCHFGAKILQARFLQVDLLDWEHSSFFRCSSETFFFQSAHLRDASSQALLTIHHKKMPSSWEQTSGHDSSLHDELRHWLPVISSPNFVFRQLRRQNAPLQTAMDKMHTMDSLLWATNTAKSKKKRLSKRSPSSENARKDPKKTPTCVAVVALIASKKARTPSSSTLAAGFSIAGAHSALCFFPPPFTVVKETWQPVLPVYTSQKQAKNNPRGVANLGLQTCMQPDVLQHASLYHLHVDLRKPQGCWLLLSFWVRTNATAIVSLVKRILFLLFWERRRNRHSSSRSYLQLRRPRPARRSTKHKTGSEGGGTVSAVGWECSRQ